MFVALLLRVSVISGFCWHCPFLHLIVSSQHQNPCCIKSSESCLPPSVTVVIVSPWHNRSLSVTVVIVSPWLNRSLSVTVVIVSPWHDRSLSVTVAIVSPWHDRSLSVTVISWRQSCYTQKMVYANPLVDINIPNSTATVTLVSQFGLVSRGNFVWICFTSPFYSIAVVSGHCLVILSLTINEIFKWLSSWPILLQKSFWWWQCSDTYIISLFPHLHTPPHPPSLISLMVSVDIKHHASCLLPWCQFSDMLIHCNLPLLPIPNKPYGFCGH